ncbi:ChbG/HpnK family deacetylase [Piscinibacter sp.]|jgi:hypothetical protein|uniref:ChbG/HpnK family deacetylase n=1 Tax=Piscinibacter sp. TaxID=1903157 RepID=UPI002F415C87
MSSSPRVLAVCADDFGLAPGLSRAVLRLAQAQRLNAISCLTSVAHWRASAALLRELPDTVDVGLHFNLTEGEPLSLELRRVWSRFPALPPLIARAHLRALPREALRAELVAQWAVFADAVGGEPAFVDGHQHVHHLPLVRELVLDAVARANPRPAIRNTARVIGPGFAVKRALIAGTGARALQRALAQRGIAHNPALVGVYDFAASDYRSLMQRWLAALPRDGALLFCHPGEPDDCGMPDAIAPARQREAAYLASDAFGDDLTTADVVLGRVWHTLGSP